MSVTVEFGPVGDPLFTFDQRDIVQFDVQRVHTAKSDAEVVVPYDADLRDAFFQPCRIFDDGDVLFRGEARDFDWSERDGTTRIRASGIEDVALANEQVDRAFTNVFTGDAIRTVLNQDTGIDVVDVQNPSTQDTVTSEVVIDASTTSDFGALFDFADDRPVRVANDAVETTPTALWVDGSETEFNRTVINDPTIGASDDTAQVLRVGDQGIYRRDLLHTVPDGNANIGVRYAYPEDGDNDGNTEGPVWTASYDGTEIGRFGVDKLPSNGGFNPTAADDSFAWFTAPVDGSQSEGPHEVVIEAIGDPEGLGPDLYIDAVIVVLDDRHATLQPDNTTDASALLDTPTEHPSDIRVDFPAQTTDYNITQIEIASVWNTTASTQALHAATTASNEITVQNTATLDKSFSTPSIDVLTGATFPVADANPTDMPPGETPGRLRSWTAAFDGDGRNVIGDQDFTGSALSVVQELADRSDYRFTFVHDSRDGSGDLQTEVQAFKRGTITQPTTWEAIDRNPTERADEYANRVTVRGALQSDGTRPTATVEAPSEIATFGVRLLDVTRPNLTTQDAALSAARGALLERAQRTVQGTIDIPPQVPLPGFSYDVDWFGDGSLRATDLERVEVQERFQDARGTLDFEGEQSIVATVRNVGFEIAATKQGV